MSVDVLAANVQRDDEGDRRDQGFERIVPQRLVHKTAAREVLLTDAVRVEPGRFYLAVRQPAAHSLYRPDANGPSDPTLFVEMLRQAAIYLSHRFYGVPLDHPFIFCGLDFDLAAHDGLRAEGETHVILEVDCRETARRSPRGVAMSLDARLLADGEVRAEGSVSWQAVHRARYTALRRRGLGGAGQRPGTAAPFGLRPLSVPALVGRQRPSDVVITDGEGRPGEEIGGSWLLYVDQSHPVFFDHPSDHVPGMLLLEAFRQASRAALGSLDPWVMSAGGVTFAAYCELGDPVRLVVRQAPEQGTGAGVALLVEAVQNGVTVAAGGARWTRVPVAAGAEAAA